jgi:hypothetical protein
VGLAFGFGFLVLACAVIAVLLAITWRRRSTAAKGELRFRFGLRTLFLTVALCGLLAWLYSAARGVVLTESQCKAVISRKSPIVLRIPEPLGPAELTELAVRVLDQKYPGHGLTPDGVSLRDATLPGSPRLAFIDYDHWVRRRLDLFRFEYVLDYDDPIVRARNLAVQAAFQEAANTAATRRIQAAQATSQGGAR